MSLTAAQQRAVLARGNVLVMAGAGTGKTRTLVERCLHCLLDEPTRASINELLVVTFTEAAAAEMKQRIRARLEQQLEQQRSSSHWQEQLALFDNAHIGTLHSFCYKLVREHFYELELDPQISVLAEEEARLLAEETLDQLLGGVYEGKAPNADAVRQLLYTYGKGSDLPIRRLVLQVHHYTQTLPLPSRWFADQIERFESIEPKQWREWLEKELVAWPDRILPLLQRAAAAGNSLALACLQAAAPLQQRCNSQTSLQTIQEILRTVESSAPTKRTSSLRALRPVLDDLRFLEAFDAAGRETDPLVEDWQWARPSMSALLQLAQQFGAKFAHAKRELGAVDFHDLEQHALRVLWEEQSGQPTETAAAWRRKLRFVLVDEYQDINAAQDKILTLLSRPEPEPNRFLVGDVKQSIYRFRLANPRIFQAYAATWAGTRGNRSPALPQVACDGDGQVIPLLENFRSHPEILAFVNTVFSATMRAELGGVEYDANARLVAGESAGTKAPDEAAENCPRVELLLRFKGAPESEPTDSELAEAVEELGELEEAAREARLIALHLKDLQRSRHAIPDEATSEVRPVKWSDMAVLLRAPSSKAEIFAREFARLDIPLQVERGGFYESSEIRDLISLLQLLDNPLQDVPALAVLSSPLVALTVDELATIRLAARKVPFWTALRRWNELQRQKATKHKADPEFQRRVAVFLDRYHQWRRLARQVALSQCLDTILEETHYCTWLQSRPGGDQRIANVREFVRLAHQFDQMQRQGLFRFLRFIEAQQKAATEPEVSTRSSQTGVRLLSIHQSKGLEFPVVVVADLSKPFNLSDLHAEIILDGQYGLCPLVAPPKLRKRFPSLAHWLAARNQKSELLGEELRLLYVAMTRARDVLLLSCSLTQSTVNRSWAPGSDEIEPSLARSMADWLAMALRNSLPADLVPGRSVFVCSGEGDRSCRLKLTCHNDETIAAADSKPGPAPACTRTGEQLSQPGTVAEWAKLAWKYPELEATRHPAKTTVSALRRRPELLDESSAQMVPEAVNLNPSHGRAEKMHLRAADAGIAHHRFLQHVDIEKTSTLAALRGEADRLTGESLLTAEQAECLDLQALAFFWNSGVGKEIREKAAHVRRELPFTFRLPAPITDLAVGLPTVQEAGPTSDGEFVVVQGVADLAVVLPQEIWLVDFKTDRVGGGKALPTEQYSIQLRLYAMALKLIYQRPVTQCWIWYLSANQGVRLEFC